METIKPQSLIFFMALDMFADGKAACAAEAYDIWPQDVLPASLNSIKIAFSRIRGRGFASYQLTEAGEQRSKEVRGELYKILEKMRSDKENVIDPVNLTNPINSVFALGRAPWLPSS